MFTIPATYVKYTQNVTLASVALLALIFIFYI